MTSEFGIAVTDSNWQSEAYSSFSLVPERESRLFERETPSIFKISRLGNTSVPILERSTASDLGVLRKSKVLITLR